MADDTDETTHDDAPPPPPEPSIDDLKAQLAQANERERLYKETLTALGSGRQPDHDRPAPTAAAPVAPPTDVELADRIGKKYNIPAEQIAPWLPVMREVLQHEAAPVLNVVRGVAEKAVDLEAQITIKDWKKIETEARKVAREYQQRGIMLTAEDAANIARARVVPQITEQRTEEETEHMRQRTTAAAQAGSVQGHEKPIPKARPASKVTKEEIERMPRDERLKFIEDNYGDAPL